MKQELVKTGKRLNECGQEVMMDYYVLTDELNYKGCIPICESYGIKVVMTDPVSGKCKQYIQIEDVTLSKTAIGRLTDLLVGGECQ